MRRRAETGFRVPQSQIRNDIYIPRYYDPRIEADLAELKAFDLKSLGQLVRSGVVQHDHGSYVPKMNYGTGPFPYIRTSDIANWELKASPKHGVAQEIFREYTVDQDVRSEDILFVHEGTYLIGSVAMVTHFDGPMLYQHHLAKFRVRPSDRFTSWYLLAAFSAPIVQRQIRSKQFSADIIDSVVGRLEEVVIPIPKSSSRVKAISARVKSAIEGRAELRERVSNFLAVCETALAGTNVGRDVAAACKWRPDPKSYDGRPTFLGSRRGHIAFKCDVADIKNDILIPKYYDPSINDRLKEFSKSCDLVSISDLIEMGQIILSTGDEIGRLAYGTGSNPFVRTSDLGTYELKTDPKHGVNDEVLKEYRKKQDVKQDDILLVRDGTYLVGSSSLVQREDLPLLFCGGIYKLRFPKPDALEPALCYALLNIPIVRQQLRNKQFTRDVIDTLGHRVREVVLPVPKDFAVRACIAKFIRDACRERVALRANLASLCGSLFG
ncbi:MAG TPA: hypothetical protein VGH23_12645 [Rhizomicrobium sp.]